MTRVSTFLAALSGDVIHHVTRPGGQVSPWRTATDEEHHASPGLTPLSLHAFRGMRSPSVKGSEFAQQDPPDLVVGGLMQHEAGPGAGRRDVVAQVRAVDLGPDADGGLGGLLVAEAGEAVEVGAAVLERGPAQGEEPVDVPLADVGLGRVDVDGEVEEVGEEDLRGRAVGAPAGLEDVEP